MELCPRENDVLVMRKLGATNDQHGGGSVTRLEITLERAAGGAGTPTAQAGAEASQPAAAGRAPVGAYDEDEHSPSEWEEDEDGGAGGLQGTAGSYNGWARDSVSCCKYCICISGSAYQAGTPANPTATLAVRLSVTQQTSRPRATAYWQRKRHLRRLRGRGVRHLLDRWRHQARPAALDRLVVPSARWVLWTMAGSLAVEQHLCMHIAAACLASIQYPNEPV